MGVVVELAKLVKNPERDLNYTYPCHQKDTVDANLPLLSQHTFGLLPKDLWLSSSAGLFRFEELFGLGE